MNEKGYWLHLCWVQCHTKLSSKGALSGVYDEEETFIFY